LEIKPIRKNFAPSKLIDDICFREKINLSFGKPHLIKRSLQYYTEPSINKFSDNFKLVQHNIQNKKQKIIIKLAVFLDETAYDTFRLFLNYNKKMLRNMILAYVNQIQAVFRHPSFGVLVDISLVRLEIMEQQLLKSNFVDYFYC